MPFCSRPRFCLVFVAIMAVESEYTHWLREAVLPTGNVTPRQPKRGRRSPRCSQRQTRTPGSRLRAGRSFTQRRASRARSRPSWRRSGGGFWDRPRVAGLHDLAVEVPGRVGEHGHHDRQSDEEWQRADRERHARRSGPRPPSPGDWREPPCTEVCRATTAPMSRSTSSGNETTPMVSATTANRKPSAWPAMIKTQPRVVVKISDRNCPIELRRRRTEQRVIERERGRRAR